MKWTVHSSLPISFDIIQCNSALDLKFIDAKRKIIVIDQTVFDLYKDNISKDTIIFPIKSNEELKNLNSVKKVLSFFEEYNLLRRSEPVIAVGGGVLLDLVGFACSIYRRGVPYIRVPTTLLAMIDAAVGIKTGINHFDRRNRLGSFYPPLFSVIDKSFIKTQDTREISNGVAEIIKLAIISNSRLFELLEINPEQLLKQKFQNSELSDQIISLAISGMINELNNNFWETNLQRSVDFGHSFSPFIEIKNIPHLLHGEAVILDCLLSSCISFNRGLLTKEELNKIFSLVKKFNLPTEHPDFLDENLLIFGLNDVMKHRNNNQFLPLPVSIGRYKIVNDVSIFEIQNAIKKLKNE